MKTPLAPPTWMPLYETRSKPLYVLNLEPKRSSIEFSRKNATPSAVISGAIRGASRSGR